MTRGAHSHTSLPLCHKTGSRPSGIFVLNSYVKHMRNPITCLFAIESTCHPNVEPIQNLLSKTTTTLSRPSLPAQEASPC
eukprot:scaffold912_cov121-Skeletonema_dohrnii-CCMP3373.AAC.8